MKRLLLLAALLLSSAAALGQQGAQGAPPAPARHKFVDLTPRLLKDGPDTLVSFTLPQARELARRIARLKYREQEVSDQKGIIDGQQSRIEYRDQVIKLLRDELVIADDRIASRDTLIGKQYDVIALQEKQLSTQKAEIRRLKLRLLLSGLGTLAGLMLLFLASYAFNRNR